MKLFFIEGKKKDSSFELTPPGVSMGREEDNDIILDAEAASRYHAKLEFRDGEWFLRDLGSTNGTKLNGTKISTETKLQEGDRITVGKEVLVFGLTADAKRKEEPAVTPFVTPEAPVISKPEPVPEPPAASPVAPAAPAAPTASEKPSIDDAKVEAVKEEKKSFMNFFSGKDKAKEPEAAAGEEKSKVEETSLGMLNKMDIFAKKEDKEGRRRKHASMLFYIIVIGMAFLMVMVFLLFEKIQKESQANRKPSTATKTEVTPLMVNYVKQISTADNIFRYELSIRDDKICVTRDDLKSQIKFRKEKKIDRDSIQKLEIELKDTDFMKLPEQQPGVASEGRDEQRTLTIAFGANLNSIRIKNTFEPTSFKEATGILEEFSNTKLEISTVSMTAEELKTMAEDEFRNAEMLFKNYNAKDENLRQAIKKYSLVVDNLECFEPKPEMYDVAYKQCQEAKKILDEELKSLMSDAERNVRLAKYQDAKESYQKVKSKADPEDPRYDKAKKLIIKIDGILSDKRKK